MHCTVDEQKETMERRLKPISTLHKPPPTTFDGVCLLPKTNSLLSATIRRYQAAVQPPEPQRKPLQIRKDILYAGLIIFKMPTSLRS